jgi:hypothetical protein
MKAICSTLLLTAVICALCSFVSANSIAITGTAYEGYAEFNGDFNIQGLGLSLIQATPDGPSFIGICSMGKLCNFSFTIGSTSNFCSYCLGLSQGSLGNIMAQYLNTDLVFSGSAVWNGQLNMNLPLTISGLIIGYELVNCSGGGVGCSLGPEQFALRINAQGVGDFTMSSTGLIQGVTVNLTGTASTTTVPEPMSALLTGSGLVGVWLTKRARSCRSA